ncbi:MAG: hypothetical protein ACP5P1_01870 [Acidimicrobiales bacterium]
MTELFVLLIGVVAFGGSIFWKRRHVAQAPVAATVDEPAAPMADAAATSSDSPLSREPGDDDAFNESSVALRTPRVRVPAPVEPPDPVVVAVCAALADGVVSIRLRTASGTKVIY